MAKQILSKDDFLKLQLSLHLEKAMLLFCDYESLTFMVTKLPQKNMKADSLNHCGEVALVGSAEMRRT